jgi:hypothetical protein
MARCYCCQSNLSTMFREISYHRSRKKLDAHSTGRSEAGMSWAPQRPDAQQRCSRAGKLSAPKVGFAAPGFILHVDHPETPQNGIEIGLISSR